MIKNSIYYLDMVLSQGREAAQAPADPEPGVATATRIVGELLDFSRVQGAAPAPVEMAALVEEALERAAVPSTITVARRLAPDLPAMSVDREQISMAVSNLIGNAMLTMAEGGTLTLETARTGEGVSLAVGDSAPASPPRTWAGSSSRSTRPP